MYILVDGEVHAALARDVVRVLLAQVANQSFVGGFAERGVDHVGVAQSGNLLRLEAFAQCFLHIDQ